MDAREQLINEVMDALQLFEYTVRKSVEDVFLICLNHYEVQERCTEIVESVGCRDYLNMYLATLRVEGKAPGTLEQYRLRIRQMLTFLGKDVRDITLYDLRYYLACYKKARKVSNITLDNIRKNIKAFFSWLTVEGHIDRNPAAALKMIKYQKAVKREYSPVELELIRNACSNKRDMALVEMLYATGARVSEISGLNISDVDFSSLEVKVLGKGNKERIVYMTERSAMYLQGYLNSRTDDNDALFVSAKSPYDRLKKPGIERCLRELGRRAEVSNVHPHRYRRTLATNLINRGCNIQDVQQILGHANISTTQIYYVYNRDTVKAAYRKYAA